MNKKIISLSIIPLIVGCSSVTPSNDEKEEVKYYWPTNEISSFLNDKNIDVNIPSIQVEEDFFLSANVETYDDIEYLSILIKGDVKEKFVAKLEDEDFTVDHEYYIDPLEKVALTVVVTGDTNICIYAYEELFGEIEIPDNPDNPTDGNSALVSYTAKTISNNYNNLNEVPLVTNEGFTFTFSKASGNNAPIFNNPYIGFYGSNTLEVKGKTITKLEFVSSRDTSNITSDVGTLSSKQDGDNYVLTWKGNSKVINLVNNGAGGVRITNVNVYYLESDSDVGSPEGVSTVAEVRELATQIEYTPNTSGWYLSKTKVTVRIEAIDCIDSVTTSNISGNARGKVLAIDDTGYIMISSGTSSSGTIDFYQAVKSYLKKGTTTYEVDGYIAFFNDVVEINVDTYKYVSTITINKNYDSYIKATYNTANNLIDDTISSIKVNANGYGVGEIVRANSLTLFNKYNSAGSYLFIDSDSNLVSAFSNLDKDRTDLSIGNNYDIIGLQSMYKNRPSLRILKIIKNLENAHAFDYVTKAKEVTDLTSFYSLGESRETKYMRSELQLYYADVYVSSYAYDKYTLNTSYYYNTLSKIYTTGTTQVNAASHYSLGVFNENLDYKQILTSFDISQFKTVEEVEAHKVRLYFTLAYRDTVDGKNMWRVNVLEDLVFNGIDSDNFSMTFDMTLPEVSCTYETGVYQEWTSGDYVVRNETTDINKVQREVTYLKVMDGTSLKITYSKNIKSITFFTSTYSHFVGFEGTSFTGYKIFNDSTTLMFTEPTKEIEFSDVGIAGENYIKITRINIVYSKNVNS